MNNILKLLGLMMIVGCLTSSKSFADEDYQQRNFFNHFTDWTVTIGKNHEERQRLIDERVDRRAKARREMEQRRFQEDKIRNQRDEEDKNYGNHRAELENQYRDDRDTMNKKLREAENDHHAKVDDLDHQWRSNNGR